MSTELQEALFDLERRDNPLFSFVRWQYPSPGCSWVHIDELHPVGILPELVDWRVLCNDRLDKGEGAEGVLQMRKRVYEILKKSNLEYTYAGHHYRICGTAVSACGTNKCSQSS